MNAMTVTQLRPQSRGLNLSARIMIRLTPEAIQELVTAAEARGVPPSTLARHIIMTGLQETATNGGGDRDD